MPKANLVSGFGKGGIVVDDLGTAPFPSGEIYDLKVLPDGSILAVGDTFVAENEEEGFVARFTPTGQLDPSFAAGGILRLNPTSHGDFLYTLEVDKAGRIVAAGVRGGDVLTNVADTWLVRLTPDGRLDPAFGIGGESDVNAVPEREFVSGLALQPDGRAVISGDAFEGSTQTPRRQVHGGPGTDQSQPRRREGPLRGQERDHRRHPASRQTEGD